jgi:hypothetical protein
MSEKQDSLGLAQSSPEQNPSISEIVDVRKGSKITDKQPSAFLLTIGVAVLIMAILARVKIVAVGDMRTIEFISLLVVGLGCLFFGAYARMLQARISNEHEFRMLEMSLRYGIKLPETTPQAVFDEQDTVHKSTKYSE